MTTDTATPHADLVAPEVRTYTAPSLRVVDLDSNAALTELRGRAVPYAVPTNVGWYVETMAAGVFAKSIRESARALPLLLWHDSASWAVGVAEEWSEADDGLDCVWRLDDSDLAQRAAKQARGGFLTGLSVGFSPIESRWDMLADGEWNPEEGKLDRVERVEARLLETSLTPTPAYAGAGVSLVRSREIPDRVRSRHRTSSVRPPEVARWRDIADDLRLT